MRVLGLVTLFSPENEYGGPVRVALNQARALSDAGHDVVVAGAARGFSGRLPETISGTPVRLFPAIQVLPGTGFAGVASPRLHRWLRSVLDTFDVAHVHLARDLVTLPAANLLRRHGIPYVVQPHGMIDPSRNPLAGPLDLAMTRPVLNGASSVFYLTPRERADLVAVGGAALSLRPLANGVPEASLPPQDEVRPEVLYLARLAPRKRPTAFVHAALALRERYPDTRFRLVGPDEGEGPAVTELIDLNNARPEVEWEGAIGPEATGPRMARSSIYALPAIDEPFPMSVLEAMSLGLPVIVTDTCGLAPTIERYQCGVVVDASVESLIEALDVLLADPDLARNMGQAGRAVTRSLFGMSTIVKRLVEAYQQ